MNRNKKGLISQIILGNLYEHYINEMKTMKSDNLMFKWIFVKKDKDYNIVLNEMSRKGIIDLRKDKAGTFVSLKEFMGYKQIFKDYYLFNDKIRNAMDSDNVLNESYKNRLESELNSNLKKYRQIS